MAGQSKDNALDHVVVVMFENRSFDNVLGRLYQPGEVESFEGVIGKELSNPIPVWAEDGADRRVVRYGVAANMDTPNPDPGEEYQHVNTQLFGLIDPPGNRGVLAQRMAAPYNAPGNRLQRPTMDGFVATTMSCRHRFLLPIRPHQLVRWALRSTGRACACRPSPSPRGSRSGPSSTMSTATPR